MKTSTLNFDMPLYGPRIFAHALPLDGELVFSLKNDLFIKKMT